MATRLNHYHLTTQYLVTLLTLIKYSFQQGHVQIKYIQSKLCFTEFSLTRIDNRELLLGLERWLLFFENRNVCTACGHEIHCVIFCCVLEKNKGSDRNLIRPAPLTMVGRGILEVGGVHLLLRNSNSCLMAVQT